MKRSTALLLTLVLGSSCSIPPVAYALAPSRVVLTAAKDASVFLRGGAEGAKIAEESVKVFSAAEKAQQFIHRGYRITPDLQKGGYWIETLGGDTPVWVNNAQEVYKHIDVISKGVK